MCSSPFARVVFSGLLKLKHRRSDNVHKVAQLKTGLSPISPPTQSSFPSAMYSHASSGHGGEGGKVPRTPLVLLVYPTRVLWPPSWDNGAVLRKWPCGRGRPGAPTALRPRPRPCGHAHCPAATPTALRPRASLHGYLLNASRALVCVSQGQGLDSGHAALRLNRTTSGRHRINSNSRDDWVLVIDPSPATSSQPRTRRVQKG